MWFNFTDFFSFVSRLSFQFNFDYLHGYKFRFPQCDVIACARTRVCKLEMGKSKSNGTINLKRIEIELDDIIGYFVWLFLLYLSRVELATAPKWTWRDIYIWWIFRRFFDAAPPLDDRNGSKTTWLNVHFLWFKEWIDFPKFYRKECACIINGFYLVKFLWAILEFWSLGIKFIC